MHWTPSIKATMITKVTARELVTALALSNVSRDGVLELARFGKSAIKRAEALPASRCAAGPWGRAAINETNLSIADVRGS
jgi:hypothetical protein